MTSAAVTASVAWVTGSTTRSPNDQILVRLAFRRIIGRTSSKGARLSHKYDNYGTPHSAAPARPRCQWNFIVACLFSALTCGTWTAPAHCSYLKLEKSSGTGILRKYLGWLP